ncbi:DUF2807 domain-containing protein [Halosquirtibacter laminarini]|uniref:DUF2807 domain-containing protein n=1 Tax=Halosquirtibacter laminarini TaxID=3374600 RepID=A0AC61NK96_9BACT|nr:DUF2807 domain-containing protein [Prolixibacteraceae bacterium]
MNRVANVLCFFMILVFSLPMSSYAYDSQRGEKGNGSITRVTKNIKNFSRLQVSNAINVNVREGEKYDVVVETDENLQDNIAVELNGDKLSIYVRKSIRNVTKMDVFITMPKLEGASTSSCGSIKGFGTFSCDALYVKASSAGDIDLNIIAKRVDAKVSSAGNIDIKGTTNELYVSSSSGGDFDSKDLKSLVAKVRASSGARIRLNVKNAFIGQASSGANIRYSGNPENVDVSTSSAGDIKHVR